MRIELHAHHELPPGIATWDGFLDAPATWLPTDAASRPFGGWVVELTGAGTARDVALHIGPVWLDGHGAWRTVRWEPLDRDGDLLPVDSLLPVFVGELGVVGDEHGPHQLDLHGTYAPPGGLLGGVLDHAGLHRVAQHTVDDLLARIAARLSERAAARDRQRTEGPRTVGTTGP